MIGDVIDRNSGFVVDRIQEVAKVVGIGGWSSQRHSHELCVGRDPLNGGYDGVVTLGVLLWSHVVLEVNFVEHLPHREFVMVSRLVTGAILVSETAVDVPTDKARVVVAKLVAGRIA